MRGLYIHIPFCIKKCKYCDFISFENGDKSLYIDRLIEEMQEGKDSIIDSIFIGGGTPTTLSNLDLERLLNAIKSTFILTDDCEWTVEANPKTLNDKNLAILKDYGVNRLSIGVQSFINNELKAIGRIHTANDAISTVNLAKRYFDNINIDIMTALPNQTIESLKTTLSKAIQLNPEHISCYSLIIEEGTPLHKEYSKNILHLPDEDIEREMYYLCEQMLSDAGYKRYEISNFAKNNKECRHNLKYWHCDEYFAYGVAAHSYIDGIRYENTSSLKDYLNGKAKVSKTVLSVDDMKKEYIIMGLRLSDGIDSLEYKKRFKTDFYQEYKEIVDKFITYGFMRKNADNYALTTKGTDVSNSILCEFV